MQRISGLRGDGINRVWTVGGQCMKTLHLLQRSACHHVCVVQACLVTHGATLQPQLQFELNQVKAGWQRMDTGLSMPKWAS